MSEAKTPLTPSPRRYLTDVPKELQDLLYEGRTIEAIKRYREQAGASVGLKEAKETVERIEMRHRVEFPGELPDRKASGCGTAAIVLVGGIGVLLVALRTLGPAGL